MSEKPQQIVTGSGGIKIRIGTEPKPEVQPEAPNEEK